MCWKCSMQVFLCRLQASNWNLTESQAGNYAICIHRHAFPLARQCTLVKLGAPQACMCKVLQSGFVAGKWHLGWCCILNQLAANKGYAWPWRTVWPYLWYINFNSNGLISFCIHFPLYIQSYLNEPEVLPICHLYCTSTFNFQVIVSCIPKL